MPVDLTEPRPHMSPELLELLSDRFGLNPASEPEDLGGSFSLNIRVDTQAGPYVARVHGTQTQPARLAAIQCARRHLVAGGVPAPEQVPTKDGEPFVGLGGHLAEVERYIEHDSDMDTWHRLELGLPYLGRTHSLLRTLSVGVAGRRAPLANHIEPDQALDGTMRGVQRMRGWHLTDKERALADSFEELAHLAATAESGAVSDLPRQLVHVDFWDNNVLFRGDDVVLVTDLDFMAERLRIDDLALTLFFANSSIGGDRLSDDRIGQMRVLVDAYDSGLADHLSAAERRALPAAIARQTLWSIGWWVPLLPEDRARKNAAWRAVDADGLRLGLAILFVFVGVSNVQNAATEVSDFRRYEHIIAGAGGIGAALCYVLFRDLIFEHPVDITLRAAGIICMSIAVELLFIRVPEGKTVKNRVHLDIGADDMESEVQRLAGLGAQLVEKIHHWTVMRDPEGNEFCVIQAPANDPVEGWRTPAS